jgi:AmmeMemoRadiSam system protein A
MSLENGERFRLLELARRSIAGGVSRRELEAAPQEEVWSSALLQPRASFVTLSLQGELRGCCGSIEPHRPLVQDVWQNAWASAYTDPRFEPVAPAEQGLLAIAISVLTPLEPIAARNEAEVIAALEPGVDGLVLRYGAACGTFLPAVWQSLPDPRAFVGKLKRKIGWASVALSSQIMAWRYQTETFSSGPGVALAA